MLIVFNQLNPDKFECRSKFHLFKIWDLFFRICFIWCPTNFNVFSLKDMPCPVDSVDLLISAKCNNAA